MSGGICIFGVLIWRNGNDNGNGTSIATVWVWYWMSEIPIGYSFRLYVCRSVSIATVIPIEHHFSTTFVPGPALDMPLLSVIFPSPLAQQPLLSQASARLIVLSECPNYSRSSLLARHAPASSKPM